MNIKLTPSQTVKKSTPTLHLKMKPRPSENEILLQSLKCSISNQHLSDQQVELVSKKTAQDIPCEDAIDIYHYDVNEIQVLDDEIDLEWVTQLDQGSQVYSPLADKKEVQISIGDSSLGNHLRKYLHFCECCFLPIRQSGYIAQEVKRLSEEISDLHLKVRQTWFAYDQLEQQAKQHLRQQGLNYFSLHAMRTAWSAKVQPTHDKSFEFLLIYLWIDEIERKAEALVWNGVVSKIEKQNKLRDIMFELDRLGKLAKNLMNLNHAPASAVARKPPGQASV